MTKRNIIQLIFVIILGLTPLLWFHGSQVVLGHDSGLTLFPIPHFFDRLYAWTDRVGFGSDQTFAIPGFFIHGLDALVASFGLSLQNIQKIVFIFWFLLPGLTMYYFATRLSKKLNLKFFVLPVTVLYMFNHFLLQGWVIAERTKFSVYAALPLVMVFLFDWEEKKKSTFRTALFLSLTIFILNGEASLPLFGGLILSVLTFTFFYFIKEFSKQRVLQIFKLFGTALIISAFLNAYWLLPYGGYLLKSYSNSVDQAGGLNGVLGWLNYVSQDSSFINIFRLQGIPDWYLNPTHPYAGIFLSNVFLIAISFLIPILAFLPLYLIKSGELRRRVIFFSFLALFSMIFVAGAHPPLGAMYVFLINFLPGFLAFRNPLYKFAPALWFSYAVLIGFTVNYLLQKLEIRKKFIPHILYFVFCFGIILYSFPVLNGMFFDYIAGQRTMRVVVPQYVFDFGKWSETQDWTRGKMLALPQVNPDNKIEAYKWGYWSPSPITTLLTNALIVNDINYMPNAERVLTEELYRMLKYNKSGWQNLAKLLGIRSFLLRNDFDYKIKGSPTDNPSIYKKVLESSGLVLVKNFGEWAVYAFKDETSSNLEISSNIGYLVGDSNDLIKISSLPFFDPAEPVYISSMLNKQVDDILKLKDRTYLVPLCVTCNLQHKFIDINSYIPKFTRDSIFYPFIKYMNSLTEKRLVKNSEKVRYYLYQSLTNLLALDKLFFQKGDQVVLLSDAVSDYGDSLENLDKNLNKFLSGSEKVDNDFTLEISDVLRIEKTIIIKDSNSILSQNVLDLLNKKYILMQKIANKIDRNLGRTTDENNKKFVAFSSDNLQYDFLYRANLINPLLTEVNFELDNQSYTVKPPPIPSEWISLGKFILSKGLHKLSISQPIENLYNGSSSVTLNSSSDFFCFASNKISGVKGDVFKISFQHRRLSGSKNFYTKILPGDKEPNSLDTTGDVLRSTSVWDNYSAFWPAEDYTLNQDGSFYLAICNSPTVERQEFTSTIELKDISIRKINVPDVVLYSSPSSALSIESKFNKKSQAEYSVELGKSNNDKIVLLRESSSSNWILESKDNIKFDASGNFNGWLVKGGNTVTIKYRLQDLVKLGFVTSVISLVLILLYLLSALRKNERS